MAEQENSSEDTTLDAESFQQKVLEHFEQYTDSATIHKNDLLDLLEDLGFTLTADELKSVLLNELGLGEAHKGAKEQKVPSVFDYEDTVAICMYFFQNSSTRSGVEEEGLRLVDQEVELHQYLWIIVTGGRLKDVNYIITRPRFLNISFTPKKVLMLGAATVMIVMGVLVVLVLSVLWMKNTHRDEQDYAQRTVHKLQGLLDEFERRNDSIIHEVTDETALIAGLFDASSKHAISQNKNYYTHLLQTVAVTSQFVFQSSRNEAQNFVSVLQTVTSVISTLTAQGNAVGDILAAVQPVILSQGRAASPYDWDVVVQNTSSGQTLLGGAFDCLLNNCNYENTCVMLEDSSTPLVTSSVAVPLGFGVKGTTVSCYIPSMAITICYFKASRSFEQAALLSLGAKYTSLFAEFVPFQGLLVNLVTPDLSAGSLKHYTPILTAGTYRAACAGSHACENGLLKSLVIAVAGNCSLGNCVMPLYTTDAFDNSSSGVMCAVSSYGFPSITSGALFACKPSDDLPIALAAEQIHEVNAINIVRASSGVEYVIASKNTTTGIINTQVTDFLFPSRCLGGICSRFSAATVGQLAALAQSSTSVSGVAPDYRPLPVAYSYTKVISSGIAIGTEKDIVSYRWMIQKALLDLIEDLNGRFEHISLVAVSNQAIYEPMPRYNPFDSCGTGNTCVERVGIGIVYRSDCVDCTRSSTLVLPYGIGACHGDCTSLRAIPLYNQPFTGPLNIIQRGHTYDGVPSLYSSIMVEKLSVGIVMHFYTSYRDAEVMRLIVIAILVCIGLFTVALILFFVASRDNLNKVEEDWIMYRKSITKQNEDFSKIVGDVVPPAYAPFLFMPNSCVSEKLNITTVFLNFVGFQRLIADQDAEFVHDYISYSFYVMNTVTRYYKMFKVKTFGDNFMIVGGVSRNLATRAAAIKKMGISNSLAEPSTAENIDDDEDLSITRCVEAAAVLMQLFSYQYTHSPQHINFLRKRVRLKEITDLGLLRIGIATGPTNLIMTRHNGFPFFLALGEPAACSYRLQQGTKTNTIHISKDVKGALTRTGFDTKLTFGHDRVVTHKKIVFTATTIHMADVPIPKALLSALKVTRAPSRMYYNDEGKLLPVGVPLGGLAPTVGHSSDRSSFYSAPKNKMY